MRYYYPLQVAMYYNRLEIMEVRHAGCDLHQLNEHGSVLVPNPQIQMVEGAAYQL